MEKAEKKNKKIKATVGQILRRYWRATLRYKWMAGGIIASASAGYIANLSIVFYYKEFVDELVVAPSVEQATVLFHIIIVILILNIVSWFGWRIATAMQVYFQSGVMRDLGTEAFENLMAHSYRFFSDHFAGSLVRKVNRYSNSFDSIGDKIVWDFLPLIIQIVVTIGGIWYFNSTLALVVGLGALAMMTMQAGASYWKIKYDIEKSEKDSEVTAALADAITNHTTVQSFSGSLFELEIFKKVSQTWCRISRITWGIDTAIEAMQSGLIIIVEFFLFYYSIKYWQAGAMSVGTFILAQTYFHRVSNSMWSFGRAIRGMYHAIADAEEMVGILEKPHEVVDDASAKNLYVKSGHIEFNNVNFLYHQGKRVLDNVSVNIVPGQRVALVGPSGAGKSTLVKLLFRFHDITSGEILIDGQNISKVTQDSLHDAISLVPQDPILFHRTLMENIRYGRKEATDEEVYNAAKLAHCHEFIENLPEKYGTYVGERGIKLSGGERQRVAIARAILKNAPILVLDEATSSLDSHSEMLIQDALDTLMKGRTTIVIAHRLSTIRKMDRIIVMDNGKITEDGTHESLNRKRNGLYKKLWKLQAGGFIPSGDMEEEKEKNTEEDI